MLKALEDLERAVGRLVEKSAAGAAESNRPGEQKAVGGGELAGISAPGGGAVNEEAAELIRRAIKRLKSL